MAITPSNWPREATLSGRAGPVQQPSTAAEVASKVNTQYRGAASYGTISQEEREILEDLEEL